MTAEQLKALLDSELAQLDELSALSDRMATICEEARIDGNH